MSKIRSQFPQTPLNLTLREEQISTILYCLEGYVAGLDDVDQFEIDKLYKSVDKFASTVTISDSQGEVEYV